MSPKRARRPNVPPFPSSDSGPRAFSRDRPSQLVSRENAQAQLLHQAIEGALDSAMEQAKWSDMSFSLASPTGMAKVGNYAIVGAMDAGAEQTFATVADDEVHVQPWIAPHDFDVDQLGIYVTTAGDGDLRIVIYQDDGSLYPGDLIYDTGNLAVNSTGVVSEAVSPEQELVRGTVYWVGVHLVGSTSSPDLRSIKTSESLSVIGASSIGITSSQVGYAATGETSHGVDPFPSGASEPVAGVIPTVWMRRA